ALGLRLFLAALAQLVELLARLEDLRRARLELSLRLLHLRASLFGLLARGVRLGLEAGHRLGRRAALQPDDHRQDQRDDRDDECNSRHGCAPSGTRRDAPAYPKRARSATRISDRRRRPLQLGEDGLLHLATVLFAVVEAVARSDELHPRGPVIAALLDPHG